MLLFEVCAFDNSFKKKTRVVIPEKCKKIYTQLTSYLKGKTDYSKLSNEARDVLFILEDELTFLFAAALLFIKTDEKEIAEYIEVDAELIKCFKEIFFRVDDIRGKIAKIGFFKRLIVDEDKKRQNLGIILKAAHTFGTEYIKWKFGLVELSPESDKIIDSTFKDMYFKYMETSFADKTSNILDHIRAGKQLISAAADIQKVYSSGGSTMDDIKAYLVKLQEEASEGYVEIDILDINEENNKIEQKDNQ